jgi:hypothetical protein
MPLADSDRQQWRCYKCLSGEQSHPPTDRTASRRSFVNPSVLPVKRSAHRQEENSPLGTNPQSRRTPDDSVTAFKTDLVTKNVSLKRIEVPSTSTSSSSLLKPFVPSSKPSKLSQEVVAAEASSLFAQIPRTKEATAEAVYCFVCLRTRILAKTNCEEPLW